MNIGIFYGSTNGNTQDAAQKIQKALGADLYDVGKLKDTQAFSSYDVLIFGTSTWYDGALQDDWDSFLSHVEKADLAGKKVALFGLGDQDSYGGMFVNGMRFIYDVALKQGATLIGSWSNAGYDYEESTSVLDGKFIGLALDEDNQSKMSDERIQKWCSQIKTEAN